MPASKNLVLSGQVETVHRESDGKYPDVSVHVDVVFSGKLPKGAKDVIEARYSFPSDRRAAYKAIFRKGSVCYFSGEMRKEKGKSVFVVSELIGTSRPAIDMIKKSFDENIETLRGRVIESGGFSLASSDEEIASELSRAEVRNLQAWLFNHHLPFDLDFAWAANRFFESRAVLRSEKGQKISVLGLIKKNPLMLADFSPELRVSRLIKILEPFKDIKITKEMELMARVSELLFRAANKGHSCLPLGRIAMLPSVAPVLDALGVAMKARGQKIVEVASRMPDYRAADIVFERKGIEQKIYDIRQYFEAKLAPYAGFGKADLREFNRERAVTTWSAGKLSTFAYLPKLFFSERYIAEELAIHIKSGCSPVEWDASYAKDLSSEQISAIQSALSHPISVIVGGAGTGKTFVIQRIAEIAKKNNKRVVVLAPTATAAANACKTGEIDFHSTIHRYAKISISFDDLGVRDIAAADGDDIGDGAFVIVDEMSMCTVPVFARLLRSLKNTCGAHIVLVGDAAQLPAVGANCFRAIADGLYGDLIPVERLTKNFRSRNKIQSFARGIRNGSFELSEGGKSVTLFEGTANAFVKNNKDWIRKEKPMVLVPTRREQVRLNELLRPVFGEVGEPLFVPFGDSHSLESGFYIGDPVVATKNDYADAEISLFSDKEFRHKDRDQNVYNGTMGRIEKIDGSTAWVRVFPPESGKDGFLLPYNAEEIPLLFDVAYALTVHKAQGQECGSVIFVVENQKRFVRRSMFYTAVTRAKDNVFLVGSAGDFKGAAESEEEPPLSLAPWRFLMKLGK